MKKVKYSKPKIEIDKKYKGLRYLVLGLLGGWRCGYVKIPATHYLYGKSYSEQLPITLKQLKNERIGKRGIIPLFCAFRTKPDDRISMDLLFNVHGGITFSGRLDKKRGWWVGFDCAHAGDAKDISLMDKENKMLNEKYHLNFAGDVIRTTGYVERECKNLIDQIIKWFPLTTK